VSVRELGLAGAVDGEELRRVLDGLDANGEPLRSSSSAVRNAAYDLTFSAPKSVSMLFGLGDLEVRESLHLSGVIAIDPYHLDIRKLRSFRIDLGTESRFGAQWALAPVAPPRRVACSCMYGRGGDAVSRPAPREGLVGDGLSVVVLDALSRRSTPGR
jgi:hypothetical protein